MTDSTIEIIDFWEALYTIPINPPIIPKMLKQSRAAIRSELTSLTSRLAKLCVSTAFR